MKKTIIGGMVAVLLFAVIVFAIDAPEGSLTIEEFLALDNATLHNFDTTFVEIQDGVVEDYYLFDITIWQPYTYIYDVNNETLEYSSATLVKEQTKSDYFACPKTIGDCSAAYISFVENYEDWWKIWYDEFKSGYE